jgi:hypothetical protein
MKLIHVFALDGCPHTRSVSDMLLSYEHEMKDIVPPRLVISHNEHKIHVHFNIIPNHVDNMKRICKTYNIPLIQSFPTIVKIENGNATIYKGNRTKRAFNHFIRNS